MDVDLKTLTEECLEHCTEYLNEDNQRSPRNKKLLTLQALAFAMFLTTVLFAPSRSSNAVLYGLAGLCLGALMYNLMTFRNSALYTARVIETSFSAEQAAAELIDQASDDPQFNRLKQLCKDSRAAREQAMQRLRVRLVKVEPDAT